MNAKLIWVRYHGRMMPQLIADDGLEGNLGLGIRAAEHKLTIEDCKLSFDELIAKYPAPNMLKDREGLRSAADQSA